MLACCLRSIAVLRPMPRTASAPAFASLSCIVTPNQRTTFARLHSAYATRARRSAGGVRVKGLVPESCVTLHHPLPPPPARALSLDAKAGGSTKHRSAILHTTRAKGDGAIAGEGKLLYRSPFSLIKAFRSLALIQTAGCVAGCSAMIWQVSACARMPHSVSHAVSAQSHQRQWRRQANGPRHFRRGFWYRCCQNYRRSRQAPHRLSKRML